MLPRELNVADLPTVVFGKRSPMWWATAGIMLVEGVLLAITVASYFYLASRNAIWPPLDTAPPQILAGTVNLVLFLVSLAPNFWLKRAAASGDIQKTRRALYVMILLGAATLVLRVFEFAGLNCRWDFSSYASISWLLLGLLSLQLLTDWADTVVLTIMLFGKHVRAGRFMDVAESADYWNFVVGSAAVGWVILYLVPRWL
jgi:heme/copper-type cytochrome/quinol oxidase subunit 3